MKTIEHLSDSALEDDSNSHSKLIEVQHVGVTAKLRSPLCQFLASTSFSNEDTILVEENRTKYDKFSNSSHMETETETSKILYEMRATRTPNARPPRANKLTPSRIEFQLYRKPLKKQHRQRKCVFSKRKLLTTRKESMTFFQRICDPLSMLMCCKTVKQSTKSRKQNKIYTKQVVPKPKQFSPLLKFEDPPRKNIYTQTLPADVHLGIYTFEHGCRDFLRTTDHHPEILSDILAARATHWATRFWAEVFGSLHIAVAFVVTFFLQSYRFLLYSLINTLFVGFLHMSSDYFLKPLLTVIFNGFLQPVFICIFNILSSLRDILAPVADNFNNFMQPLASLGRSFRLVDVQYSQTKSEKGV